MKAIFVGWVIPLLVWMLHAAQSVCFWTVGVTPGLIGVGHLSHPVGVGELSAGGSVLGSSC